MSREKIKKPIQSSIWHRCWMAIVIYADITLIELLFAILNLGTVFQCIVTLLNEKLYSSSKKCCKILIESLLYSLYFLNWISYAIPFSPFKIQIRRFRKKTAKKTAVKIWAPSVFSIISKLSKTRHFGNIHHNFYD